jgi:hypothetical protein
VVAPIRRHQIRTSRQPQHRQGARHCYSEHAARHCRRGDRMIRREFITLLGDKPMTEVIRKDRTSSLRCRPVRSALQARAGRPLPNSCPCASYSGWLGQSCGDGMKFLALLPPAFCGCRYWPRVSQRNLGFYAHLTALARRISPFRHGAGVAFKWRRE